MPEGWDGTIRDKDEVHYDISKKEDDMLYRDFVLRMKFCKKNYVRGSKRPQIQQETLFTRMDYNRGETRAKGEARRWWWLEVCQLTRWLKSTVNEMEKLYVKREKPRRRRKFLPPNAIHRLSSIIFTLLSVSLKF